MHLLVAAWQTETTIKNCFIKGGFHEGEIQPEDNLPLPEGLPQEEFDEWVCIDDFVEVSYRPTDEEICFE